MSNASASCPELPSLKFTGTGSQASLELAEKQKGTITLPEIPVPATRSGTKFQFLKVFVANVNKLPFVTGD